MDENFSLREVVAICDHLRLLFSRQLPGKIAGETPPVPFHLLVKSFRRHPVQFRQIGIEQHSLTTDQHDGRSDLVNGNDCVLLLLTHSLVLAKAFLISPHQHDEPFRGTNRLPPEDTATIIPPAEPDSIGERRNGKSEIRPSPPAPLPEGEGRNWPSPPAPLPKGRGEVTGILKASRRASRRVCRPP